MSSVFYPDMFTSDECIKIMGEEFWSTLVTLNGVHGFQVTNYHVGTTGNNKRKATVLMANAAGVPACQVGFGPIMTQKRVYKGDGIAIGNVSGTSLTRSTNPAYINRSINSNPELRDFLKKSAEKVDHYDKAVQSVIEGYNSTNRSNFRSYSCSTSQDQVLLKHALFSVEGGGS